MVGVADLVTSNDPGAVLVTYSLGSCIGVTVYDPVRKVGGLIHLMLPDSTIDTAKADDRPAMFVDTGVPRLFHAVYAMGGDKSRLVVTVAGGAELLDSKRIFNIGARNAKATLELLARNGVTPRSTDVGGHESRTIRLDVPTGTVTVVTPGKEPRKL